MTDILENADIDTSSTIVFNTNTDNKTNTNTNTTDTTILSIPEDDTVNAWNDDNDNNHTDNILNTKAISQDQELDLGATVKDDTELDHGETVPDDTELDLGETVPDDAELDLGETVQDDTDIPQEIQQEIHQEIQQQEIQQSKVQDDSDDDSDDGFGDFNEADDDFQFQKPDLEIPETITNYTHDYKSNLNDLFDSILSQSQVPEKSENSTSTNNQFQLNERCQNIYSRLIEDPMNVQFIKWKKSIIRKQLYLTLNIPIDITELPTTTAKSTASNSLQKQQDTDIHNIYDTSNLSIQSIHSYLIQSIPQFDKLNINDEEFNEIINTTSDKINKFSNSLQSISFFQNLDSNMNHNKSLEFDKLKIEIDKMNQIKSELLKISSCWDNKINISKKDNDIFSAYVSNLVENTQKLRRSNTAKKIKKRR
ncbi:hypothetical protein BVG19_g235 [[Candida] boidinii]|nr:hypothetical protein BVG19_g235 [[Candida] boidinii]OWB49780.1 hypothetical protein B5S27_g1324 [[Candida] boidinii]OWB69087.1 hypothetical protein B5S30_g4485 [[Candida] boidinii]OWB82471.1 hypothetical protein B5S33_g1097 [[Candida] boidinii]